MMDYVNALDGEMALAMARMREIAEGLPNRYELPFPQAREQLRFERQWWLDAAPAMHATQDTELAVSGRAVRLRCHRPASHDGPGSIVYFHGGGWCVGSNDTHDSILRHLAAASGCEVVGVDYSLAPEHPFPAALADVAAATAHAAGSRPFVLAGDSAGANLALVEAIRRRDARLPQAAGLVLFYGAYGPLNTSGSGAAYGSGSYGLSIEVMRRYLDAYLGDRTTRDPRAYPVLADVRALPPVHLGVAQLDPLLDDSMEMARRLAAAGTRLSVEVYAGVIHGFLSQSRMVSKARDALLHGARFAAERLAAAAS
jgi:acetyl esterase